MKKIKVGVIGTGFIGPAHVEALRRLPMVEVAAVAEAGEALARKKADELGIEKAYGDYKDMLADAEIVSVHNCTPNFLHFQITSDIIKAGKHVVSEKPLAMTTKESRKLVAMARKAGVANAIDFNYRFYPLTQQARAMVKDGDLGDVFIVHGSYLQDWLYLKTDYNWRLEPSLSGDSRAVADIGSHWCDLIQFITGQKIVRVFADFATIHPIRMKPAKPVETYAGKTIKPTALTEMAIATEDYATLLLEFDKGARGALTVSQVSAGRKNRLYFEIDGSKCAIAWDQEDPNEMWIGYREKANELLVKDPSLLKPEARKYAHFPGGHPEGYPEGPRNLFENFYRYIIGDNKEINFSTFADGHAELCICEAALKSARARKWVDVDYR
ncbi:MAG TPA: Gfo/Idh/MocA family oxidoreductase [Planctomycetota bacterium]|nr:Gfo/Idh/MocA family oxidoreductase [Planctomycetota bacterium]